MTGTDVLGHVGWLQARGPGAGVLGHVEGGTGVTGAGVCAQVGGVACPVRACAARPAGSGCPVLACPVMLADGPGG